jgi:hypothetical protein
MHFASSFISSTFCAKHKCIVCAERRCDNSEFCLNHKCSETTCENGIAVSTMVRFCVKHKCIVCTERRCYESDFCWKHKCTKCNNYAITCVLHLCKMAACLNGRMNNSDVCSKHKCGKCDLNVVECVQHKCAMPTCVNTKVGDSMYCVQHKCTNCNNNINCQNHKCAYGNFGKPCNLLAMDKFDFCSDHKCSHKLCFNDRLCKIHCK